MGEKKKSKVLLCAHEGSIMKLRPKEITKQAVFILLDKEAINL